MNELKINHAAVWVSTIVAQFIPPLWYDYVFFGIRWMELNDFKEEDFAQYNMAVGLTLAFAATLAAAYVIAWLFTKIKVKTGVEGMKYALIFWVGFRFLEVATQNMFTLRPFELTLIDESVVLVQYQIIGITLGIWKKYKN
ncbi:DUF1761 domain-containing protein [Fulvivirga sp. RKSG066]|uniref:DUF1761 domain-containing protein n=1 Tax=Fulvivirga aurantia TaxID=2529383 RepID=UPI0012BBA96B|nr:DUF1761 domain-containing protein [Fulvivirga aurantia]MTI21314.1 DUF1761 domain-containing protein [Fulvivirga aurantia]